MIRSVGFGSTSSTDLPPVDKEICIREVINAAGRAREAGLDCKVGKLAKKLYLAEHPGFVFPKNSIYANGQLIEASCDRAGSIPTIKGRWSSQTNTRRP